MKSYVVFLTVLLFVQVVPSFAQIGNLKDKLKQKGLEMLKEEKEGNRDILKEVIAEEAAKKQQGYDTTSFNYAIAFLDKSESFENKQKGEGMVRATSFWTRDQDKASDKDNARDLFELGRINYNRRMYKLAEQNLVAAILAYELLEETEDPIYLKSLGLLGLLYSDMGRYEKALESTTKAKDGWEQAKSQNSQGFTAELLNIGVVYMNKAMYNEAETILQNAATAIKSAQGATSVPYAIALNNLGILYQYMGRSDDALKNLNQAVEIAGSELRGKSGTYIQLLTNKALVQQENNLLAEAEKTYLDAKQLQESRLKLNRKSDPDYAHLLNNLASLYMLKGQITEAEGYLKTSLEIYTAKFGDSHPVVAEAQADLGNLYRYQQKYVEAEPLVLKALKVREDKLGKDHPKTVQSEEDLAVIKWKTGKIHEASALFADIMAQSTDFINTFFPPMSEVEKTKYWDKLRPRFDTFYNFAFDQAESKPELLTKALENRMATKGLLLSASNKIKSSIMASGNTSLIQLYITWQDQKQSLAIYYNMTKEEIASQRINIDSLQQAANQSEKQLSAQSSVFAESFVSQKQDFTSLVKVLKPSETIIEMVHYPYYGHSLTRDYRYAALVVQPGSTAPTLVQFPAGTTMDTKAYAAYRNMVRLKMEDDRSYATYWQPLEAHLPAAKNIYFSPDGVYNQLNINTLLSPEKKYVVDKYAIRNIGNPADLLNIAATRKPSKDAFLVGFPDYGTPAIAPLSGTLAEVTAISQLLKTNGYTYLLKTKADANEKAIKAMTSPGLLHIATHGYFMEDVSSTGHVFGVQVEYAKSNPLLRSGLMLAGASRSLDATSSGSFDQHDNGIFTAYEAINLTLTNTEMVVLSACETGKGDIKSGEGVYGLQRAFKMAGAARTVMSLWKVDDEATQQLMKAFYTGWTKDKLSPDVAFRKAQIAIKEKFPQPYYWGAFVMME